VAGLGELLRAARYVELSGRDVEVAHALNERDYLTQTFVRADADALGMPLAEGGLGTALGGASSPASSSRSLLDEDDLRTYPRVKIWYKSFETERKKGRLLLEKLDFLQSRSFRRLLAPLGGRRAATRLLGGLRDRPDKEGAPVDAPADLRVLWDRVEDEAAGSARFLEAVSSEDAFGSVFKLLQWPLTADGALLGMAEVSEPVFERMVLLFAEPPPRPDPVLQRLAKALSPWVSVLAEGGELEAADEFRRLRARLGAALREGLAGADGAEAAALASLSEEELEVLEADPAAGLADPEAPPPTRLRLFSFRDIPWASLRLVFPERRLAFSPLEVLRLDLLSVAAALSIAVKARFVDIPVEELSRPVQLLTDTSTNTLAAVGVGAILARIVLAWTRALTTFELKIDRMVQSRRTTDARAALEQAAKEAAAERAKEVLAAYGVLLRQGEPGLARGEVGEAAEAWLLASYGVDICFDPDGAAVGELARLGLAEEIAVAETEGGTGGARATDTAANAYCGDLQSVMDTIAAVEAGSGSEGELEAELERGAVRVRAVPPDEALRRLRVRWAELFEAKVGAVS